MDDDVKRDQLWRNGPKFARRSGDGAFVQVEELLGTGGGVSDGLSITRQYDCSRHGKLRGRCLGCGRNKREIEIDEGR